MREYQRVWEEWQYLADKTLQIDDHLPISSISRFGDSVWDFAEPDDIRRLSRNPGALRINWHPYILTLPTGILLSAKVLGFFVLRYPTALGVFEKSRAKGLTPIYCCRLMSVLLAFLEVLCVHSTLPVFSIHTLADFSVEDIRRSLVHWTSKSTLVLLRPLLTAFSCPLIQPYLPSLNLQVPVVLWTKHDLATIDFTNISKKKETYRDKPLPDSLFRLLVNVATQDVITFLTHLGRSPQTISSLAENPEYKWLGNNTNFGKIYEAISSITATRCDAIQKKEQVSDSWSLWWKYERQFNVSYWEIRIAIRRIQMAARYLLLQFTGLRFSEAVQLQVGCVQTLASGEYVIRATVTKGRATNLLPEVDYWVACPIVRDAVAVLEELTRFTQSTYLFAPYASAEFKERDAPLTNHSFIEFLNAYVYDMDEKREYSAFTSNHAQRHLSVYLQYRLTPHRLRHTLVLHMGRARLGIPYISFHLKHVYSAHNRLRLLQDVTLKYGGLGTTIFNNAIGLQQAHREMVDSVYHPDAPIAGPGADEFKARRKEYFKGMLLAGQSTDEVLELLSTRGVLMADVGLGYCQGRREIEQDDGSKVLPPCLGQLKCNPVRCKNAVIPSSKTAIWVQMYKENNQRLHDPLLAYAWPEYQHFVEEAKQVLLHLGVNTENL